MTQKRAAEYFGCTQAFISLIERKKNQIPDAFISKIKGDPSMKMISDDLKTPDNLGNRGKMASTPYFPDINASAGLDFLADNGHNHSIPISIPNVDAEAFINVFGDSMYPKFCSGEIIGIKQIQKDMVFFGHAYVVEMIDNEAYLKYIKEGSDKDHWILASENTMYQPQEFHLEKIRKIFIIKAVISKITLL